MDDSAVDSRGMEFFVERKRENKYLHFLDGGGVVGFFMNAYAVFIIMSALISVFNVGLRCYNVMSIWKKASS